MTDQREPAARAGRVAREDERRRPVRQGVMLGAVVAVFVASLIGLLLTLANPSAGDSGSLRQAMYPLILIVVIFACRPLESPKRLLAIPIPLVLALAWCWLSVAWAIEPGVSLRRIILTTVVILSVFTSIQQVGYTRTVAVIRVVLAVTLIGNLLTALLVPSVGIHQADELFDVGLVGDWRGFMLHKNFAGAATALTVLVFLFDAARVQLWLRVGVIALATFFLVKSGSRTSMGVCIAAVAVGLLYVRYNARYRGVVLTIVCLLGFGAALMSSMYHNPYAGVMQDKTAFTGRTQIWSALTNYIGDNPLLGSGYGSFWNIGGKSPIYEYATGWVAKIGNGHNGFLDLLAQVGVPGLLLIVFATVVWPLVQLFRNPATTGPRGALIFSILLFCVIHNLTESSLFDRDVFVEVFLMTSIALLCAVLREPVMVPRRVAARSPSRPMSFRDVPRHGSA